MDRPKRIQVRIGNMTHQLIAYENEAYIRSVAKEADDRISFIRTQNPSLHEVNAIVLALVNTLDEMRAALQAREYALTERDRLLLEAEEVKAELMRERDQYWELKKSYLHCKSMLTACENKLAEESRKDLDKLMADGEATKSGRPKPAKHQYDMLDARQCVIAEVMENKDD